MYCTTSDIKFNGGRKQSPPNVGLTSCVLPEINTSQVGNLYTRVSTNSVSHKRKSHKSKNTSFDTLC